MAVGLLDHAPNVAAAVITLGILAAIVFPLRAYVRISNKAWGIDDWCMSAATIPFTALTIVCLGGAFNGVGVHQDKLNDEQTSTGLMWFFLFEILYCISVILIKLSISFMLIRVAGPMQKYTNALYAISALFTVMNLIALFYIIFQCQPVSFFWAGGEGSCNDSAILASIYYADTAVNIATDWFCALLPIPLLWNLQLNRNAKLSVVFLLSLGVLASLSACIRLKYTVNLNNSEEFLHGVGDVVIWGYAENAVGLIVGCTSTLRPLVRRIFHLGDSCARSGQHVYNDGLGENIEFKTYAGPQKGMNSTTIKASHTPQRRGSYAYDSGSESEEQLVKERGAAIQVSTSIRQQHE